jgi:PAS domain S-box-containing protein
VIRFKSNQQIKARELFDENIYSDSMLNSILGPVAFYRWKGDNVDIIRYNEQFYEMVGIELEEMEERRLGILEYLYPPDREKFIDLLQRASENYVVGARDVIRVYKPNGLLVWLMIMVFYLSEDEGGKMFYASASDITDLQLVNSGLPGGYIRCAADDDYEFLHISNNMMELVGYDSEEIKELFDNKLSNMIHPDDIETVRRESEDIKAGKPGAVITPYRIRRKRGDYIYVAEQSILSDKFGALCWQSMLIDVTDVMKLRNQMYLLTEAYKSTVLFLHRENGNLVYDVVVNGLEKILGMDSTELETYLNDGLFCHYIREYNNDIPHNEYTERFVGQLTGNQKMINVDLPGDRHLKLLARADRVEDEKSETEYILNLSLA